MNAKKLQKIEKKLTRKGQKKITRKNQMIQKVKEDFEEWLKLTKLNWWKK